MIRDSVPGQPASRRFIEIRGARENNLRNVSLEIPHGVLTVITGVSGSGKSSLAMDTLYAEGQRRYLDGVSSHARRFLERLPRPDVDRMEGLCPAVSLAQRSGGPGARSTVGTSTEILDYLRLLFARVGEVRCDQCGEPVPRWTVASVADHWNRTSGERLLVGFPVVVPRGRATGLRRSLETRGYLRGISAGRVCELGDLGGGSGEWWVLQDRLPSGRRPRLVESLEAAFREGGGQAGVAREGEEPVRHRLGRVCARCDASYPESDPLHFSFNSPVGACGRCQGFGFTLEIDPERVVPDPGLSLEEGALAPFSGKWRSWFLRRLESSSAARGVPRRRPWRDLDPEQQRLLIQGGRDFVGAVPFLERLARKKSYKAGARFLVKRYQTARECPDCRGTRLQLAGRRVYLGGASLPDWCREPIRTLRLRLEALDLTPRDAVAADSLIAESRHRLEVMERVGLGYLSLDRMSRSLSGGEAQRIELAHALGARLVGALYVLDEPTVGLHPRDTARLLEVLRDLTAGSNSVVVVEHDRDVMLASDWLVDLGPGSGAQGGQVVYCGPTVDRENGSPSPTLDVLRAVVPARRRALREPRGWLRLRDARVHNLRGVDADLPGGTLVGVCGVSGSGKSSLVADTLIPLLRCSLSAGGAGASDPALGRLELSVPLRGLDVVDQSPLGRSSRSIPASYVGAWAGIRSLYAALPDSVRRGLKPGYFSFNVPGGRCEVCRGEGETTVDMDFMPDVRFPCEVCEGRRFLAEAEGPRFRGRSIVDVLRLTVDEAVAVFHDHPSILKPLWWLQRVGLGYLTLGQPGATLSGGEAQRLKLVRELGSGQRGRLLVLDEPTVGLHAVEVARLLEILHEMVDAGNTVLVVEHQLEVLAACDWLVEMGPGGGEAGGRVVSEGPPEVVARHPGSPTGEFLRPHLEGGRDPADSLFPERRTIP